MLEVFEITEGSTRNSFLKNPSSSVMETTFKRKTKKRARLGGGDNFNLSGFARQAWQTFYPGWQNYVPLHHTTLWSSPES